MSYERGFDKGYYDGQDSRYDYGVERTGPVYQEGYIRGFNDAQHRLGFDNGRADGQRNRYNRDIRRASPAYQAGYNEAQYQLGLENGRHDGQDDRYDSEVRSANPAYRAGYDKGYDEGYSKAQYQLGFKEGRRDAKDNEDDRSFDKRASTAYKEGYSEGYGKAKSEIGFDVGFNDGQNDRPNLSVNIQGAHPDYCEGYTEGYEKGKKSRIEIAAHDPYVQIRDVSTLSPENSITDMRFSYKPNWERIIFSQRLYGGDSGESEESKSILMKLNRGEYLPKEIYESFIIQIEKINLDTQQHGLVPGFIGFENLGKHTRAYLKYGSAMSHLEECYNFQGNFLAPELKEHIKKETKSLIGGYKFEEYMVGVSFKPNRSKGINLEIKFKVCGSEEIPFILRGSTTWHPQQVIILNLHLKNETAAKSKGAIALKDLNAKIMAHITEFFQCFVLRSAALNFNVAPSTVSFSPFHKKKRFKLPYADGATSGPPPQRPLPERKSSDTKTQPPSSSSSTYSQVMAVTSAHSSSSSDSILSSASLPPPLPYSSASQQVTTVSAVTASSSVIDSPQPLPEGSVGKGTEVTGQNTPAHPSSPVRFQLSSKPGTKSKRTREEDIPDPSTKREKTF